MRRHVLQQKDGVGALDLADVPEGGEWILRPVDGNPVVHAVKAIGNRPVVQRQPQVGGYFAKERLNALLLDRFDRDERVIREDQALKIVNGTPIRHRGGADSSRKWLEAVVSG